MNTLMAYMAVTKQGPFAPGNEDALAVGFIGGFALLGIAALAVAVHSLWTWYRNKRK